MTAPRADKQIVRVLDAVRRGCETSNEVSVYTGIFGKSCAARLVDLWHDGLIVKLARPAARFSKGRPSHRYRIARRVTAPPGARAVMEIAP